MNTTSLTAADASGLRLSNQANSVISSGVRRQMLRYDVGIQRKEPSASRRIGACLSQKAAIADLDAAVAKATEAKKKELGEIGGKKGLVCVVSKFCVPRNGVGLTKAQLKLNCLLH